MTALLLLAPLVAAQPPASCNIMQLPMLCMAMKVSPNAKADVLCKQPCVRALIACSNNPMLSSLMGAGAGAQVAGFSRTCSQAAMGGGGAAACDCSCQNPAGRYTPLRMNKGGLANAAGYMCSSDVLNDVACCAGSGGSGHGTAGDGKCNKMDLMAYKRMEDTKHPGAKPDCKSTLAREAFDCINDPILAKARADILKFQASCGAVLPPPPMGGGGSAGNGKCEMQDIAAYSAEEDARKKAHPGQKDDPAQMCKSKLILELFDCMDNPMMAAFMKPGDKKNLQSLKTMCAPTKHGAGDGVCNMMDLMKLGQVHDKLHKDSQPSCTSKLALEAFDCINNPLLASDPKNRADMLAFKRTCEAPHGSQCMAKMATFNTWWPKGGVCCPPGDKCNTVKEVTGPPAHCTKPCAMKFLPFVADCGDMMVHMLHDDKVSDTARQAQIRSFSAMCTAAMGGH